MPSEAYENEKEMDEKQTGEPVPADTDDIGLDLSSERLTGLEMQGADLSHANLSSAMIAGSNLAGANLANARLNGTTVAGVNLEGANFSGADLTNSRWIAVNIKGADFGDATTTGAKSVRVDWSSSRVPPAEQPGPMVRPLIFMPLIVLGGLGLSLYLRWTYRKRR